jgi:hypothetical protein
MPSHAEKAMDLSVDNLPATKPEGAIEHEARGSVVCLDLQTKRFDHGLHPTHFRFGTHCSIAIGRLHEEVRCANAVFGIVGIALDVKPRRPLETLCSALRRSWLRAGGALPEQRGKRLIARRRLWDEIRPPEDANHHPD